jgi:hypothetical protein
MGTKGINPITAVLHAKGCRSRPIEASPEGVKKTALSLTEQLLAENPEKSRVCEERNSVKESKLRNGSSRWVSLWIVLSGSVALSGSAPKSLAGTILFRNRSS